MNTRLGGTPPLQTQRTQTIRRSQSAPALLPSRSEQPGQSAQLVGVRALVTPGHSSYWTAQPGGVAAGAGDNTTEHEEPTAAQDLAYEQYMSTLVTPGHSSYWAAQPDGGAAGDVMEGVEYYPEDGVDSSNEAQESPARSIDEPSSE